MLRFTALLKISTKIAPPVLQQKCSVSSKSSSSSDDDKPKKTATVKLNPEKKQKNIKELSSTTSSSSSSSTDDEKLAKTKSKEQARTKLNLLLTQMLQDDVSEVAQPKLDLAKPKRRRKDVRTEAGTESVKSEPVSKQIVKAVTNVANIMGGDVKKTESELLQKLLHHGEDDVKTTTSNLSDIFKDMKIDREVKAPEQISRAQQVQQLLRMSREQKKSFPSKQRERKPQDFRRNQEDFQITEEKINLHGNEPLGIFPSAKEVENWPKQEYNQTWEALHQRELRLAVTHPPSNYFQQMILWTEQGKLWKFPIDNEQGLDEEKKVYFAEHIFVEKHLESWCPSKGPIRHFMELVCVGLSKNHYLTVERKKEHIEWYRNYFAEKKQLLQEVGAVPKNFDFSKSDKLIEKS